ncbi:MAG: hypothetical protein ACU83P_02945 [Gammaproteobacteria bacterium]
MKDHSRHHPHRRNDAPLYKFAFTATLHCWSGCAIGEITGAAIGNAMFWSSLAASLSIAAAAAFPLNRWVISMGQGHAPAYSLHCGG